MASDAAPPQPAGSQAAGVEGPDHPAAPGTSRHRRHHSTGQSIDEAVQRLARTLDLDPVQQAKVRTVLEQEHRQLRQASTDNSSPGTDHVGQTRAIVERTREEIRDILTDEQRKKYPGVTPGDLLGPAHTDLDRWLRATQGNPGSAPVGATP